MMLGSGIFQRDAAKGQWFFYHAEIVACAETDEPGSEIRELAREILPFRRQLEIGIVRIWSAFSGLQVLLEA